MSGSARHDFSLSLPANHRRSWLNAYGGESHSAVQVGQHSLFETARSQPLEVSQRFFL